MIYITAILVAVLLGCAYIALRPAARLEREVPDTERARSLVLEAIANGALVATGAEGAFDAPGQLGVELSAFFRQFASVESPDSGLKIGRSYLREAIANTDARKIGQVDYMDLGAVDGDDTILVFMGGDTSTGGPLKHQSIWHFLANELEVDS